MRAIGAVFLLLALAGVGAPAQSPLQGARIVVPEYLGIPAAGRWPNEYYPRNVWDMQAYSGHLYLGAGNSSNFGPSPNAGPVPIYRYDGRRFELVLSVQEEQIDVFRVLSGSLFVPGHDGRRSGATGSLYRFDGYRWEVFQNIQNGVHVYDVYRHGGQLIAVGGSRDQDFDAWISGAEAGPWRAARLLPNPALFPELRSSSMFRRESGRLHSVLEIGGRLYASGAQGIEVAALPADMFAFATLFRFDGLDGFAPVSVTTAQLTQSGFVVGETRGVDLFPGRSRHGELTLPQVRRPVSFRGETVYVGSYRHNDHQWIPFGVFAASSLTEVRRLLTPESVQVYDLLAHDGRLYALGNKRRPGDDFEVQLLRLLEDGARFEVVVRFASPTFARSFEFFRGDWYFGLGSEVSVEDTRLRQSEAARVNWRQRLSAETGAIVRIRGSEVE